MSLTTISRRLARARTEEVRPVLREVVEHLAGQGVTLSWDGHPNGLLQSADRLELPPHIPVPEGALSAHLQVATCDCTTVPGRALDAQHAWALVAVLARKNGQISRAIDAALLVLERNDKAAQWAASTALLRFAAKWGSHFTAGQVARLNAWCEENTSLESRNGHAVSEPWLDRTRTLNNVETALSSLRVAAC